MEWSHSFVLFLSALEPVSEPRLSFAYPRSCGATKPRLFIFYERLHFVETRFDSVFPKDYNGA